MQIKQTKEEELVREFTVNLTAEEIETKINERLQELGKTVKMPGFRPGKVPLNLLKAKYGQAVMGEVLEQAVNDSSRQAINENDLRPAMQPKIEVKSFEEGQGLEYTMAVELLPEFELADFKKIKLEKLVAEPADESVEEALKRISENYKQSEKVDTKRAAKEGDILLIDFTGTVDGKAFPGMEGNDHELELGSNSFIDTFEEQLVGAKPGDKKTVTVTFPEPYHNDELSGKEAKFEVEVKEIRKAVLPEIDDEFAAKLGFEDAKGLKDAVKEQIKEEYDRLSYMVLKRNLLDELDTAHDFKTPPGMVEAEFEGIWQQMTGQDPNHVHDENCDHDHDEEPDLDKDEYKGIAERRVKLGLVLAEVGRQNDIEVGQQELQQAVIAEARRYPGQEREVFEYYQKTPQALETLRAPLYENKVVDFILEMANISTNSVSIEELEKASEAETPQKKTAKKSQKTAKKGEKKAKSGTGGKKESQAKKKPAEKAAKATDKEKKASTKKK